MVNYMKAKDITVDQFLNSCKNVVDKARTRGWRYGNSTATPPCSDGIISCDRLIARALYDLGFTDQRRGGETCGSLETYLSKHGFIKSNKFSDIKKGSILLVKHAGLNYWSHAFVALSYNSSTWITSRYDTGSNQRIQSVQPLKNVSWGYRKDTVCVFNIPKSKPEPIGDLKPHKLTQEGQRYLRTFMNTGAEPKADGVYDKEWKTLFYKAIQTALNKDHKLKLKVDGTFNKETQAALKKYPTKYGTKCYLNSVLEIGLYLNNKNPNGFENPGIYKDGLKKAVAEVTKTDGKTADLETFLYLI